MFYFRFFLITLFLKVFSVVYAENSTTDLQKKIVNYAESFLGREYDPIPIGNYVEKGVIVDDSSFDCMSLTFRVLELALSKNEEESLENALWIRFKTNGARKGNSIKTYEGRFEYGEDMALSGKFGRLINHEIGKLSLTSSKRYEAEMTFVKSEDVNFTALKSGDIIYFVKKSQDRKVEEIVGHLGFVKVEDGEVYLIHASGVKNKGGEVKKVPLDDYLEKMKNFDGILITRL